MRVERRLYYLVGERMKGNKDRIHPTHLHSSLVMEVEWISKLVDNLKE